MCRLDFLRSPKVLHYSICGCADTLIVKVVLQMFIRIQRCWANAAQVLKPCATMVSFWQDLTKRILEKCTWSHCGMFIFKRFIQVLASRHWAEWSEEAWPWGPGVGIHTCSFHAASNQRLPESRRHQAHPRTGWNAWQTGWWQTRILARRNRGWRALTECCPSPPGTAGPRRKKK